MRSWSVEEKLNLVSLIHRSASFINECHLYGTQSNILAHFSSVPGTVLSLLAPQNSRSEYQFFVTCSVAANRILSGAELCESK